MFPQQMRSSTWQLQLHQQFKSSKLLITLFEWHAWRKTLPYFHNIQPWKVRRKPKLHLKKPSFCNPFAPPFIWAVYNATYIFAAISTDKNNKNNPVYIHDANTRVLLVYSYYIKSGVSVRPWTAPSVLWLALPNLWNVFRVPAGVLKFVGGLINTSIQS